MVNRSIWDVEFSSYLFSLTRRLSSTIFLIFFDVFFVIRCRWATGTWQVLDHLSILLWASYTTHKLEFSTKQSRHKLSATFSVLQHMEFCLQHKTLFNTFIHSKSQKMHLRWCCLNSCREITNSQIVHDRTCWNFNQMSWKDVSTKYTWPL